MAMRVPRGAGAKAIPRLRLDLLGQFDHDASARKIDRRHHDMGEWQQHGRAMRRRDLDDVAGAEIVDRDDVAERVICERYRGESDQVGVVILVLPGVSSLSRAT